MRFRTVGYVERGEDFPRFVTAARHEQRAEGQPAAAATYPPPRAPLEVRRSWARLIRQVDEVDSLVCPRCGGTMRVIAVIEQPAVIGRILDRFPHRGANAGRAPLEPVWVPVYRIGLACSVRGGS